MGEKYLNVWTNWIELIQYTVRPQKDYCELGSELLDSVNGKGFLNYFGYYYILNRIALHIVG